MGREKLGTGPQNITGNCLLTFRQITNAYIPHTNIGVYFCVCLYKKAKENVLLKKRPKDFLWVLNQ